MTLTIEVYSSGTTPILDVQGELKLANGISFSTYYSGGIYGTARLRVPRRVAEWWAVNGGQRLVLRSGLEIAYEGVIDNLVSAHGQVRQEVELTATGMWGHILQRRRWNKPWADSRLSEDAWPSQTVAQFDKFMVDRMNRLQATPKQGVAYANNDYIDFAKYFAPTGETIKRITFNYDMQEAAQAWTLALYNDTASALVWLVGTSGTGSRDEALATPASAVHFYFQSNAAQTGIGDGTIYGKITNVVVYTETGAINLTEVAKDIRAKVADLNSTEIYIGSNTLSLVPFITNGWGSRMADILVKAAEYGDASFNPWACYVGHSELAPTVNGKGVLVVEQKPGLLDSDYIASVEELAEGVTFEEYYDDIWNWIVVEYQDAGTGGTRYMTPDDDANLKDQASITDYGQRDYLLEVNTTSSSQAVQAGRRFLSEHKSPKFRASGQVRIRGTVRTVPGSTTPAALVRAGKRLRITNALQQGIGGGDLIFLITSTDYTDEDETVGMAGGPLVLI